jgi:filamentous hemagglutinin family protein
MLSAAHTTARARTATCGALFVSLLFLPAASPAAPAGTVVGGPAVGTINQQGATTLVNVTTSRAVINWSNFNVANGQAVRFTQPSSSSVLLNRVTGAQTAIDGAVTANGRIFIANPRGILFGPNAQVNVASLVATTADTSPELFLAGNPGFRNASPTTSSIINRGHLTAEPGGNVLLLAPTVVNQGTITAQAGTIVLATGRAFLVDLFGDGLVQFATAAVTGLPSNRVTQIGNLEVGSGTVLVRRVVGTSSLIGTLNSVPVDEVASSAVILPGGAIAFVGASREVTATIDISWIKPSDNGGGGVIDPSPVFGFSSKTSLSSVASFEPPPVTQTARLSEFNRLQEAPSHGLVSIPNSADTDLGAGALYTVGEPERPALAQRVGFTEPQSRPVSPEPKVDSRKPCTVSELLRQGCR